MRSFYAATLPLAVVALAAFACAPPAEEPVAETPAIEEETPVAPAPESLTATAALTTADGVEIGTATFTQVGSQTTASFHLVGVSPAGTHAIHVHENGECTPPDFTSAGGHFNPLGVDHACPPTTPRHAGDFGNVEIAEDGSGHLELATDLVTVEEGPTSVVGKAVILHAHHDDCTTQPTGGAGDRLACGVIALTGGAMDDGAMDDGAMDDGAMDGGETAEPAPGS
jgi:Cu-Zn family superoxide dismutase